MKRIIGKTTLRHPDVIDGHPTAPRFLNGYKAVEALQWHARYTGAIIFGSVAEGTADKHSDLDVKVVVDEDNICSNISHPVIDGYKLDISFASISQLTAYTEGEMKKEWGRSPNLATALIVFDKTGELHKLKQRAKKVLLPQYIKKDYQFVQFMLYHANNKVERYLEDDPVSALYSMHANIGEVLKIHYRLHRRWWVSSKRVFGDLNEWDKPLAKLLARFVSTADVAQKYAVWAHILDHITQPMGGRQPIQENNCDCETCAKDLQRLVT